MKDIPALLEKNLEIMSKYQPKLAQRLRQELDSMDELPAVDIQETASGRWVTVGESAPFFDKEPVLPKTHKSEEESYCFIVQGIGYPPYLFHVLRGISKDALSIVVFEPNVHLLLLTLSMTSVYHALPKLSRMSFIVYSDRDLLDESVWHNITPVGIFPILDAKNIVHPGLMEVEGETRQSIHKEFWEQIRFRAEQLGNSAEDTLIGVRHGALNTPWILTGPNLSEIKEILGKRPAVCVASGPSLKNNVDQLKGMEEKCLIVSCDTALMPLLRRGIRPHAVVTIERNLMYNVWVPAILDEFYEECRNILLVSQSVSEPLITGRWPGPVLVVGKMDSPADMWVVHEVLGKNLLASGMCVAHMAMNFSIAMEAPTVALIGQDLAFDEDGETTHIEDASSATPTGIAVERAYTKREVPGALGGVLKTHQMWFYYLQLFERFLDQIGPERVFQCSEGGAAINGTEAIPLKDFFRRFLTPDVPQITSSDISEKIGSGLHVHWDYQSYHLPLLLRAEEGLLFVESLLDEMEREVDSATAAALLPEKRRIHAFKTAELLDQLHASHRALAFIGQSYTHIAGSALAKNRFLDTVERVKEWEKVHREIIASHRINVSFLSQWLRYMKKIASQEIMSKTLEFKRSSHEAILAEIRSCLERVFSEDAPDILSQDSLLLSFLLCRIDLERCEDVLPETLWNVARFFGLQGRHFEAHTLMERAYGILEDKQFPSENIASFLLDWAHMEAQHDLIRFPRFDFAIGLLQNAQRYAPDLKDLVEQEKLEILRMQKSLQESERLFLRRGKNMTLLEYRNRAQEALALQDLPSAFSWVMKMDEHFNVDPRSVLPYMQWLAQTALDCRGAVDPKIDEACEVALSFLFERQSILSNYSFPWPARWADYLREKGVFVFF